MCPIVSVRLIDMISPGRFTSTHIVLAAGMNCHRINSNPNDSRIFFTSLPSWKERIPDSNNSAQADISQSLKLNISVPPGARASANQVRSRCSLNLLQ